MFRVWQRQKQWVKITSAITVGVSLGIVGAALSVSHHHQPLEISAMENPEAVIVPVSSTSRFTPASDERATIAVVQPPSPSEEMERLKTRNRRLEALVEVLKQRAANRR